MNKITNTGIALLAQTLAEATAPTPAEIINAMELAYNMGRVDGGIEALDNMLRSRGFTHDPAK